MWQYPILMGKSKDITALFSAELLLHTPAILPAGHYSHALVSVHKSFSFAYTLFITLLFWSQYKLLEWQEKHLKAK